MKVTDLAVIVINWKSRSTACFGGAGPGTPAARESCLDAQQRITDWLES